MERGYRGEGKWALLRCILWSAFESVKGKVFPLMPCGERPTAMSEYFLSPKPVVLNAGGGACGNGWFLHRLPGFCRCLSSGIGWFSVAQDFCRHWPWQLERLWKTPLFIQLLIADRRKPIKPREGKGLAWSHTVEDPRLALQAFWLNSVTFPCWIEGVLGSTRFSKFLISLPTRIAGALFEFLMAVSCSTLEILIYLVWNRYWDYVCFWIFWGWFWCVARAENPWLRLVPNDAYKGRSGWGSNQRTHRRWLLSRNSSWKKQEVSLFEVASEWQSTTEAKVKSLTFYAQFLTQGMAGSWCLSIKSCLLNEWMEAV